MSELLKNWFEELTLFLFFMFILAVYGLFFTSYVVVDLLDMAYIRIMKPTN